MSTLHVTNGDSAANTLRTFLRDPVITTCDVLHEGPVPALEGKRWYDTRARFLAGDDQEYEQIRRGLETVDGILVDASRFDEVVLWFEHDLFDQLLLIRTLDRIARIAPAPRQVPFTLICIDRFPGVERFVGLGQLSGAQLATLVDTRQPVRPEQYALASRAWAAFRAADPMALNALASEPLAALPFLAAALRRFLAEYPSTTNGLSMTGNMMLRALAGGSVDGATLFHRTQSEESRPFMGDWTFFELAQAFAAARIPLVSIDGTLQRDLRPNRIELTAAGRDVLDGKRDAITLNGIDTWRGGVHLEGHESRWRWDENQGSLISWA